MLHTCNDMRCIIIDDEPKAIEVLQRYADRLPDLNLLGSFRDPVAALAFLKTSPPDLIFLDINMPGLNGIQLLDNLEHPPLFIFTTAYPEYAVQSYELEALDYLLKPILFDRFETAVVKARKAVLAARQRKNSPPEVEFVLLKSGAQTHRVPADNILFLKKEGNYFTVFTRTKKIVIRQNMESALRLLPAGLFCRVHRSYIISLRHVAVVGKHSVQVANYTIPVGGSYRNILLGS